MSDACFSSFQDILVPKKSSLLLRMITLVVLAVICGISFSIVFLKQFNIGHITLVTLFPNVQVSEKPCPRPDLEDWEVPYVHFPKPVTYSREECACHPVRYFAIVSMQRSGSGWFETLLNSHMNVSSNGEIFSKARRANVSIITETLDKLYNLDWMSSSAKNECTSAVGLKWMLNQGLLQYHEDIAKYFSRKGVSIIFLFRRNLLRQMVSKLANIYDHDNKLLNGTHKSHVHSPHEAQILASYKPYLNATTMIRELKLFRNMVAKALNYFNSTRHITLYYEDVINNQTKLLDVQDFLRVPRMNLTSRQVKIHKGPLSQQVANWDDVERTLSGTEFESFLHDDYRL